MIKTGHLNEFVRKLVKHKNEEAENRKLWELYLHHPLLDKTFDDFKELCGITQPKTVRSKPVDFTQTVATTFDILQGFSPEE